MHHPTDRTAVFYDNIASYISTFKHSQWGTARQMLISWKTKIKRGENTHMRVISQRVLANVNNKKRRLHDCLKKKLTQLSMKKKKKL